MSWSWPAPGRSPPAASETPRWRSRRRRIRHLAAIIIDFQVATVTLTHTERTRTHSYTTTTRRKVIEGGCVDGCACVLRPPPSPSFSPFSLLCLSITINKKPLTHKLGGNRHPAQCSVSQLTFCSWLAASKL
jgi:hypothetical protein